MRTETKATLTGETIEDMQDLISINLDSAKGFTTAAEQVDNPTLAGFFRDCAAEREGQARDLQTVLARNDVEPKDSGTVKGSLHRAWLDARGAVQGGDEHAVLAEAERGEDAIKACYEKTLKGNPGNAVSDMLHAQYDRVKQQHDRVRDMRDARS